MEAIQKRKVLLYPEDPSFPSPSDAPFLLVAPLLTEDRRLGVIYQEQDSTQERFQEKDRILIQTLSHEIAYGMERVQLYARIREETRIRAQLERFFSPQVVELILKESQLSPDLLLPPGGWRAPSFLRISRGSPFLRNGLSRARWLSFSATISP